MLKNGPLPDGRGSVANDEADFGSGAPTVKEGTCSRAEARATIVLHPFGGPQAHRQIFSPIRMLTHGGPAVEGLLKNAWKKVQPPGFTKGLNELENGNRNA
jgi:hypothetical protein